MVEVVTMPAGSHALVASLGKPHPLSISVLSTTYFDNVFWFPLWQVVIAFIFVLHSESRHSKLAHTVALVSCSHCAVRCNSNSRRHGMRCGLG